MALPTDISFELDDLPTTFRVPFLAWNRLQGRPRTLEFEKTLKAELYDPAWMLGRQWQMGEFKAEDSGSVVSARIATQQRRISHFRSSDNGTIDLLAMDKISDPLEPKMEGMEVKYSFAQMAHFASRWNKLLLQYNGAQATLDAVTEAFNVDLIEEPTSEDLSMKMKEAKSWANPHEIQLRISCQGKVPDASKLYSAITSNDNVLNNLISSDTNLSPSLDIIKTTFRDWIESLFTIAEEQGYKPGTFEYKFGLATSSNENSIESQIYVSKDYKAGKFDWYSVDKEIQGSNAVTEEVASNEIENYISKKVLNVIPTPARFVGMPVNRWWEMEDSKIDFANTEADSSQAVKLAIMEFATSYSNDWFVTPLKVNRGAEILVEGILVKDCFGENTLIKSSIGHSQLTNSSGTMPWSNWSFFKNSEIKSSAALGSNPILTDWEEHSKLEHLLIPPTVHHGQFGPIIEEVNFIRDEMDNRVWAVESSIFDWSKGTRKGERVGNELREYLESFDQSNVNPTISSHQYKVLGSVPENWIPFVPRNESTIPNRSIVMKRSAMPRFIDDSIIRIRPRTNFLRNGLDENDQFISPLIFNEEEFKRSGIKIIDRFQRCRWYNGKTFSWYSRETLSGRDHQNPGLLFDSIHINKNSI